MPLRLFLGYSRLIESVVSSKGCDSVRSIAWEAKWPSFWGTLALELEINWSILIRIFHIKKNWTIDANDNRYVEIIVKLGQKNCGTYSRIAISKDIVILSIVIRRFYCTFNHSLRYPSSNFGVPELDQGWHKAIICHACEVRENRETQAKLH